MEQRVAKKLDDMGWRISQSFKFEDQDTKESREIDILAHHRLESEEIDNLITTLDVIIECKGYNSPLIVFPRQSTIPITPSCHLVFSGSLDQFFQNKPPLPISNWFYEIKPVFLPYLSHNIKIGYQACTIKESKQNSDSKFHADNSDFYDAIEPLIKTLHFMRMQEIHVRPPYVTLRHLVLIWRKELYLYNYEKKDIEPIDSIPFYYSNLSEKVKGDFFIDIIREDKLESPLNNIKNNVFPLFLECIEDFLSKHLNKPI